MKSSSYYIEQMKAEQKRIDSGKLTGKKLAKARKKVSALKWRAKVAQNEAATIKSRRGRPAKPVFNPAQGILPNFLANMDFHQIEERLVEAAFKRIANNVTNELNKRFGLVVVADEPKSKVG